MSPKLKLNRIGQIAITVTETARAEAFYREVLGLDFLFGIEGRMSFFDCSGVRVMLAIPENPKQHAGRGSIVYFAVDDIDNAFEALMAREVSVLSLPHLVARLPQHELWMGFFEDSEGNTLALMEERRQPKGRDLP